LRLPTEQTLPLTERRDAGLKLQQLLESEQCSLADAKVAFEKLRSAKNCPGKVHRQFKKLQQASDEYVEQLQQALNRREISEAMDKWAHCHREFSRMQSWVSGKENSLRTLQSSQKTSLNERKDQLTELEKLLDSINALESKFNGWQKLKEEFSDFLYDDNLTSRYKSLQDTAQVVGDMRRSVSLQNVFDSHVAEFQSWLDQQELRIGAVLNKPDNEICLRPFADDPDIEEAEEKLKELKHIEKFFNQTETYWLMNTHSNGRALIDSCRQNANLQRETESRISAMDSLCKQVKSLTEETDARKGDFELLLQLEIGKRLAQSDELNAVLRERILQQKKGIEKLYGKLKVQLESKK
uniref:Nesprin-1 n=1 Tax=Macrostomum lignano TaxID=282301 RepID=A0A1I8GGH3_9PLAT